MFSIHQVNVDVKKDAAAIKASLQYSKKTSERGALLPIPQKLGEALGLVSGSLLSVKSSTFANCSILRLSRTKEAEGAAKVMQWRGRGRRCFAVWLGSFPILSNRGNKACPLVYQMLDESAFQVVVPGRSYYVSKSAYEIEAGQTK